MIHPKFNRRNCEKLANQIVDNWDINTMADYAASKMADDFLDGTEDDFNSQVENEFQSNEDDVLEFFGQNEINYEKREGK